MGLIQYIQYITQLIHFLIFFSIDPWNCADRSDNYANVADNIDWIKKKIGEHESTNRKSSGSIRFKSHVFTSSFIMSGIYFS